MRLPARCIDDADPLDAVARRPSRPKSDEVLWQRDRPAKRTKLKGIKARIRADNLALTWKCDATDSERFDDWVRWSADSGKTWNALSVGLSGESAELPISHLPGRRLKRPKA